MKYSIVIARMTGHNPHGYRPPTVDNLERFISMENLLSHTIINHNDTILLNLFVFQGGYGQEVQDANLNTSKGETAGERKVSHNS
jgi:hypothetical protein